MTGSFHNVARQIDVDGFAIVPGLLPPDQIDRLIVAIESLPISDVAAIRTRGRVAFARRNLLNHDCVRELAWSEAAIALPRLILGENVRPVRGILFNKTPDANWVVPWHQDLSIAVKHRVDAPGFGPWSEKAGVMHVQPPVDVLRHMLTVRIHLDECDDENGPLRVIPGSHSNTLTPNEIAAATTDREQITCCCPVGGALLMRPMILHASSPARSPRNRRVIHIEYAGGDLPDGLQWHAT